MRALAVTLLTALGLGMASNAAADPSTYTALNDGTAAVEAPSTQPPSTVGSGRYAYRFTLRDPHTGLPWPRHAYALSINLPGYPKLPFVNDEKGVYQGTTDDAGIKGVFRLPARIADQHWEFGERFGGGPYGERFKFLTPNSERPLAGAPYLISVCSTPVFHFRGYSQSDGKTGYVASPRPSRLVVKLLADAADDGLPDSCAKTHGSGALPTNEPGKNVPPLSDGVLVSAERFVLCYATCIVVDELGRRVSAETFQELQPFDGDLAVFGEAGRFGAIDRNGKVVFRPRHAGLSVLGHRFVLVRDQIGTKLKMISVYDLSGRRIFRRTGPELIFDVWAGHLFYQESECAGSNRACPAVFLDDQGKQIAQFAAFVRGENGDAYAAAALGARQNGFIDATLNFVVPPIYWYTQPFIGEMALVASQGGPLVVIDRTGHVVVPPGRYHSLYLWSGKLLITAFRPGDPNCPVFIRPDGRELPMKKGMCADKDDTLSKFGYALVRDSRHRFGTIDAQGRRLISPRYKSLSALSARYLVFSDDPGKPTAYGVVRADGKVVLRFQPARIETIANGAYASPAVLRDLFVARAETGFGLLDTAGHWRVPPIYHDRVVFSSDLIALEKEGGEHEFVDGEGRYLPLTSRYIGLPDPVTGAFWFEQCSAEQKADPHNISCPLGIADRRGRVAVSARFDTIESIGTGLWHVAKYVDGHKLWGVYNSNGIELIPPAFAELDKEAGRASTVASSATYRQVLIDARGHILAQAIEQ